MAALSKSIGKDVKKMMLLQGLNFKNSHTQSSNHSSSVDQLKGIVGQRTWSDERLTLPQLSSSDEHYSTN